MNLQIIGMVLAAATSVQAPTGAAHPTASFRIDDLNVEMPLPSGFCRPEGDQAAFAEEVAAADDRNATRLTLYPCQVEAPLLDFILVKTPVSARGLTIERERLLNELGEEFQSGPLSRLLSSGEFLDRIDDEAAFANIDLSGSIRPLGRDDVCAYLGGTITLNSADGSNRISYVTCMTSVSGRILSINWYAPDRGSQGIAQLLVRARQLAGRITPAAQ